MDDKIYEAIKKEKSNSKTGEPLWESLAKRFGFQSKNAIRNAYNREHGKRGDEIVGREPVIKVMDLENLPLRGYPGWGLREQHISADMVTDDKCLLGWAGYNVSTGEIESDILTPKEAIAYNSRRLAHSLRNYISDADFVIGFNWQNFDRKLVTTELTLHNLKPVQYRTVDVYQLLTANYGLTSYSLKFTAKKFGIREKMPNEGFALWRRCAEGNKEALQEMRTYNEGDVLSTWELYLKIRSYVGNSLPNFNVYGDMSEIRCQCDSTNVLQDGDHPHWYTNSAKYVRYVCNDCGSIFRGRKNLLTKAEVSQLRVRI